MKRFSPMLAGGVLCTVGLVGFAAVQHRGQPDDNTPAPASTAEVVSPDAPLAVHHFMVEGPERALRINFSDLDLLTLANVEVVTPDVANSLPDSVKGLDGQIVRLRGYMKTTAIDTGIGQFLFVRSTDMCCFGPKGRVDHLASVILKAGTTTDFIDLQLFDVQGRFRIEVGDVDGVVTRMYHLDDAAIIQR
jgi:hypothetical protein